MKTSKNVESMNTANVMDEKNVSTQSAVRSLVGAIYAKTAVDVFIKCATHKFADGAQLATAEEIETVRKATKDFTEYYTQPSENTTVDTEKLSVVGGEWNKDRLKGNIWYKGTQAVENAFNVFRSYTSYMRMMDDKENGKKRELLKRFKSLSIEEQMKLFAALG